VWEWNWNKSCAEQIQRFLNQWRNLL
jgi:hypothetical protein